MRRFCLVSMSGGKVRNSEFLFLLTNPKQIDQPLRRFSLTVKDIDIINPNTLTSPTFRTNADAELTKKIYRTVPVLENERTEVNPWSISFMRMFDMSNDDHLFQDYPNSNSLSLYEGKMLHQFDHRFGYYTDEMRDRDQNSFKSIPSPSIEQKQNPHFQTESRKWVDRQEVDNKLAGKWDKQWLLAFRDITNATNERTAIFSIIPKVGIGHTAPILFSGIKNNNLISCLISNFNSLVFDFISRQKVGGTHLTFTVVRQLPVLPPESYTPQDIEFISSRVLELVYTAWDMQPFAQDMGYEGTPFMWNPERRAILRAELDAKYAKLYGLTRDELRYILDPSDVYGAEFPSETFRVLKGKEMKEYGEYRTQRLVLTAWDLLESGGQMLSEVKTIEDFEMIAVPSEDVGIALGIDR
jgi:hypothetical protein